MAVRRTDIHTHDFSSLQTTQTGLEPVTSAVTGRRSNQLSHWAIKILYLQNFTQILQTLLLKNSHLDYFFQKFRKPVISIPLRSISMILLRKTAPVNSHSSVNKFPHCVRFHASVFLRFWSSPRPISGSPLHVLPHFHSCPIYLILFQGSYFL